MANNQAHEQAQAILTTARSSIRNVFFIGPYGRRISFASQQRRALNVVWALSRAPEWPDKPIPKVAVIGGGIAGVMAAAALVMRQCAVKLYEKEPEVLQLQELARHRTIHPSINFWPQEELRSTTTMPFFDWYPDTADAVLDILREEWVHFKEELSNEPCNIEVTGFGWQPKEEQVVLKFRDGRQERVDIALVASGFGKEEDLGDSEQRSYWEEDQIDELAEQQGRKFLVSGTGDGGLIDALRLTYPRFMSDERALAYLDLIDSFAVRQTVVNIENAASFQEDINARARLYKTRYCRLAMDLPLKAQKLFPKLPEGKLPVELVGQFAAPFEAASAPIHKLILAHALNQNSIRFLRGNLSRNGGIYYLEPFGKTKRPLVRDRIVVRHGTDNPVAHFLGTAEANDLRARQERWGDFLNIARPPPDFFVREEVYRARNPKCPDFVETRRKLAAGFLRKRHGYHVKVGQRSNGMRFFVAGPIPETETSPLPRGTTDLFGIRLEVSKGPTSQPSDGVKRR